MGNDGLHFASPIGWVIRYLMPIEEKDEEEVNAKQRPSLPVDRPDTRSAHHPRPSNVGIHPFIAKIRD